jgi:protease II
MILIEPLKSEHKYDIDHHNGYFYVQTNINKSTNWKIMKVKIGEDVSYSNWKEFIPYNKNVCINNFTTLEKYFILYLEFCLE